MSKVSSKDESKPAKTRGINPTSLTPEQEQLAVEMLEDCKTYAEVAKVLGFTSKTMFWKFKNNNLAFKEKVDQARISACEAIEDKIMTIHEDFDPKMGRVMLEAYTRILAFRIPSKYSQKLDLNLNQTISIRANLDEANNRLGSFLKEVNPALIPAIAAKTNK